MLLLAAVREKLLVIDVLWRGAPHVKSAGLAKELKIKPRKTVVRGFDAADQSLEIALQGVS
jgi:hypothetical protein